MNLEAARALPNGTPVIHTDRGAGVWYGIAHTSRIGESYGLPEEETSFGWVKFPAPAAPVRVSVARLELP